MINKIIKEQIKFEPNNNDVKYLSGSLYVNKKKKNYKFLFIFQLNTKRHTSTLTRIFLINVYVIGL